MRDAHAREEMSARAHEAAEGARRERQVLAAVAELGPMSLERQRDLREESQPFADGFEAGMLAAQAHLGETIQRSNRLRALDHVRKVLADHGLDPQDAHD
jgi:hypothetical protein